MIGRIDKKGKKIFIFLFAFITSVNVFAIDSKEMSLFKNIELPYECMFNSPHGEIARFIYRDETDYELDWNGLGFFQVLSSFRETKNEIIVEFLKIWIGTGEEVTGDKRMMYKYSVHLDKTQIINGLKEKNNVQPVFIAEDVYDSVNKFYNGNPFLINKDTNVKKDVHANSKTFFQLNRSCPFELLDIVCSSKSKDDVWVKIKYNEKKGFIPLSSLADNWTVKVNNLTYKWTAERNATLNDSRVRLREDPNLTCETWDFLSAGEKVQIIDRSEEKFVLDCESWYWYQVETKENLHGWIYGKYLDIE